MPRARSATPGGGERGQGPGPGRRLADAVEPARRRRPASSTGSHTAAERPARPHGQRLAVEHQRGLVDAQAAAAAAGEQDPGRRRHAADRRVEIVVAAKPSGVGRACPRAHMHADHADLDGPADFDETFREHYWPMVRSLSVACGDREAAADAVQDAFTRAYARWRRISRYEHPAGWIRHVALNRLRDHFRHEAAGHDGARAARRPDHRRRSTHPSSPTTRSMAAVRALPTAAADRGVALLRRAALGAGDRGVDEAVRGRGEVPPARGPRRVARSGSRRDERRPADFDPVDDELRRRFDARRPARGPIPTSCSTRMRPPLPAGPARGGGRRSPARPRSSRWSWSGLAFALGVAAAATARCASRRPRTARSDGAEHADDDRAAPAGRRRRRHRRPRRRPRHRQATTPTGSDATAANGPSGTDASPPPAPTTAPAGPRPARTRSAGGSITVNFDGRRTVSLASSSPAAGFTAEVHDNGPDTGRGAVLQRADRVAHPGRRGERSAAARDHAALSDRPNRPAGPGVSLLNDPPGGTHGTPNRPRPVPPDLAAPAVAAARARRRRRRRDGARALRGGQLQRAVAGVDRPWRRAQPRPAERPRHRDARSSTASWSRSPTAARPRRRARRSTTPTPTVPAPTVADHARAGGGAPGARARRRQRRRRPVDDGNSRSRERSRPDTRTRRDAGVLVGRRVDRRDGGERLVDLAGLEQPGRRVRRRGARQRSQPGRGALLSNGGQRVAHPGRARQRRPDVGDHPARVISVSAIRLQPSVRGASSADGSSRYATTCQRAVAPRHLHPVVHDGAVAELDRVIATAGVVDRWPPGRRRRARRGRRASLLLRVRGALGGDEAAAVEPVAQLAAREREERLEVEAIPRQLVGDRDLAGAGPSVAWR